MIGVSDRYKQNMTAPIKQGEVRMIEQNATGEPVHIFSGGDLIEANIEALGEFLGTGAKVAKIKLLGMHNDYLDKLFSIELGIKDPVTNEIDWSSQGIFKITKAEVNLANETTLLKAQDLMLVAYDLDYTKNTLQFPATVKEMAERVAERLGLTLDSDFATLPNASHLIQIDLYLKINGANYRSIIDDIAGATGTTAIVSDGKLLFRKFAEPTAKLEPSNLMSVKVGKKWGIPSTMVLSRKPQNDNILLKDDIIDSKDEVIVVNNQILDQDRQGLITPLFEALIKPKKITMSELELVTEGHGVYEIGDVIQCKVGTETYTMFITNIKLDLRGAVKETLIGKLPIDGKTDHLTAGGVMKTIWNTEIKTDKQKQQIEALVEQQIQQDNEIASNFSQILQMVNNISQSVQKAGGINLIKNSVGFGLNNDRELLEWEYSGTLTTATSPESVNKGAISGHEIRTNGVSFKQRVSLGENKTYTLSYLIKKGLAGSAKVKVYNDLNFTEKEYSDQKSYDWTSDSLTFYSEQNYVWVEIEPTADLAITDLMLCQGEQKKAWQQANGEMYNTKVSLNERGLTVSTNGHEGDYVAITSQEFAGYSDVSGMIKKVFTLNRDTTMVEKLSVNAEISMPPLRLVPFSQGQNKGWAILPSTTGFTGGNNG